MKLTAASRIVATDEKLKPLAEVLAGEIVKLTGLKLSIAAGVGTAGDIVLKLDPSLKAGESILVLRNREPVRTTSGALTTKSLTIDGIGMPPGVYTVNSSRWIEGKGKVIVEPRID